MVHKYKVGKLKTLSYLANSQTSQLQITEFAFLGLIQRLEQLEVAKLIACWAFVVDLRSISLAYPL